MPRHLTSPSSFSTSANASRPQAEAYDSPPEYTSSDAENLLGQFSAPPSDLQSLALPLALPQISSSYDSPFLRAYSSELVRAGVQQDEWLRFIDGLNIAMVSLGSSEASLAPNVNGSGRLLALRFALCIR